MCGLTGLLGFRYLVADVDATVRAMVSALSHRGPDGEGVWIDRQAEVALGHRRLSIIELSDAGAQPMHSASGNWVTSFNGEVYNHLELREELFAAGNAPAWRSGSDTETLLACLDAWGIERTLSKVVGMFAMAIWSVRDRRLTLVRDRFGEKPLYFGWVGPGKDALVFGSELRSLEQHPAYVARIDRSALSGYMSHLCVSDDNSIAEGVRKVPPGSMIEFRLSEAGRGRERAYWVLPSAGVNGGVSRDDHEVVSSLEEMLRRSVRGQMLSDVPLGAFLSGGVDSSAVVGVMQSLSAKPIRTFSIGFSESSFDEAPYSKAVADYLRTDHTELYVSADAARAVIPELATIYDEPFADSSQIPTLLVSRLARRHVTVALSGDAGDEVFGGYNRYLLANQYWPKLRRIPSGVRGLLGRALLVLSPDQLSQLGQTVGFGRHFVGVGSKIQKAALVISAASEGELYSRLTSAWHEPVVLGGGYEHIGWRPEIGISDSTDMSWMMRADIRHYLPSDILVKVDRAAMSTGLETRVPFLDHRLVEWANSLPLQFKIRREGGRYVTKWALRQVLYRYVPAALIDRPKMGFGIPLAEWLRGPLAAWADALLDPVSLRSAGYFDYQLVRQKWDEHQSRRRDWEHQLWCVLMFQAWLLGNSGRRYS
ncbi:MAG: asparagine synthase (glutamine-hydrolyzing) [Gammaproteobacteria bacterium]|nr:asparagine synthase (glutamine-hydrolyzing) [Gammaproteobacteria bacterium]